MNYGNRYRNFNKQHSTLTAEELIETYYRDVEDNMVDDNIGGFTINIILNGIINNNEGTV